MSCSRHIYPSIVLVQKFFEIGIPNLVCKCILGISFSGHCDLDLVLRIIVYGAYLLYGKSCISSYSKK